MHLPILPLKLCIFSCTRNFIHYSILFSWINSIVTLSVMYVTCCVSLKQVVCLAVVGKYKEVEMLALFYNVWFLENVFQESKSLSLRLR